MEQLAKLLNKAFINSPRGEQARLQREMGVRPSTMNRWLTGKMKPNGEHTLIIVEYLRKKEQEQKTQ